jgi:DNA-binding NarL/FixJ family response regulator
MRPARLHVLGAARGQLTIPDAHRVATTIAVAVVAADPRDVARVRSALAREGLAASVEHGGRERLDAGALERRPDVVVLVGADVDRALAEGHAAHRRLRGLHVILVLPRGVARDARHVLGGGFDGVVLEPELERTLALAVRAALSGQLAIPRAMRHGFEPPALSHRSREILRLVVAGQTNGEIAAELYLSKSTVARHLTVLFRRLGVRSRSELVGLVLRADDSMRPMLVGPDPSASGEAERGR